MKNEPQNEIDKEIVKAGLGTGADQRGGQDKLDRPRRTWDDGPVSDDKIPGRKSIMGEVHKKYRED